MSFLYGICLISDVPSKVGQNLIQDSRYILLFCINICVIGLRIGCTEWLKYQTNWQSFMTNTYWFSVSGT